MEPNKPIRREVIRRAKIGLHEDPMRPSLLESPQLEPSQEQLHFIKEILDVACSDSRFAQKAYASIVRVLNNPEPEEIPPTEPEMLASSLPIPVPRHLERERR